MNTYPGKGAGSGGIQYSAKLGVKGTKEGRVFFVYHV